ncbi:MAG: hypothetical protein ABSG53_29315 [Thermoguttaceae bacterium]
MSLPEFLDAYARYSGSDGYYVRVAYPWAWTCWRPWQYGWYWQSGWHRRPGVWQGYAGHPHPYVAGPHRAVTHVRPVKHAHPVAKPRSPKHSGKHKGSAHRADAHQAHAHQGHHR